ncbi:hypothetical protein COU19_02850 [Candidatus Kaiserbacteria bacterium CG10_big_fil_rev_8_21_14_0_10_56_12]|uniref:Nudix hydrolase domain-containing protein n=1 Tax=Candidatus Kaiserbacteria bacterium CG10_big_fil_rev_8_21_14_0_10_56_12 TaxID=1974611 RepID=A0A2H0U982_9BACT|nr:MAG: hypothetical protein COU19_02850 [Candidatus Kaiserbacteria bacterium CG10_big_fil_rev_8_21_14_0_10_56_12]
MRTVIPQRFESIPDGATKVFEGVIFDVYQWPQELFDGTTKTFEMLKRPDTVKIIAVKNGKIVILEEQQPRTKQFYSLPGGRHDISTETERHAAERELLEETGMQFAQWKLLRATRPHVKIDWIVYIFLATDFMTQVSPELDGGEKIILTLKTLDEIREINARADRHDLGDCILDRVHSIQELIDLPAYHG